MITYLLSLLWRFWSGSVPHATPDAADLLAEAEEEEEVWEAVGEYPPLPSRSARPGGQSPGSG